MKKGAVLAQLLSSALVIAVFASAQKIETVEGVRVVHNSKGGAWGTSPKIALQLVRTIGDVNTTDDNFAFNNPQDLALDRSGNIYILDSGNQRVQKFGPAGTYLATIGRKGQGPGEFTFPGSLSIDPQGRLSVLDDYQKRIEVFTPDGRFVESILIPRLSLKWLRRLSSGRLVAAAQAGLRIPGGKKTQGPAGLLELLNEDGSVAGGFGEILDYGDDMTNSMGNSLLFAVDSADAIVTAFVFQNRIEKYSPDGRLLWRADRELNYTTKVLEKGKTEASGNKMLSYRAPRMNRVVSGVAADGENRVWMATFNRQIRKDEEVMETIVGTSSGETRKISGNTDLQTTNMFKLEVFDSDGLLLGEIPVTQFMDGLFIFGDRLFALDRDRGVKFYEYRIIEK
jgi:sugar lactone lactonase YvrE